jgi:eukaryotic-like serine/threonine-protein kinase
LMQGRLDSAVPPAEVLAPVANLSPVSPASRRVLMLALGLAAFGLVSASVGATLYFVSDSGEPPPARAEAPPPRPPPPPPGAFGPPGAHPPPGPPPLAQGGPPPGPPGAGPLTATPVRAAAEPAPVAHAVDRQPAASPEPQRAPQAEPKAPEPSRVWVGNAVQLHARGTQGYGIPVGSASGLKPEMVLQVVGSPGPKGLRKVLGQATVEKVEGPVTTVRLDAAALRARGPRFVALPEARPAPAPAEAKVRVLEGGAKISGLKHLNKRLTLYNREDEALTNCVATLSGKRRLTLGTLPKGFKDYNWRLVRPQADAPDVPAGTLRLQCTEGSADFPLPE